MKKLKDIFILALAALLVFQLVMGWYMTTLNYYHPWYHKAPLFHKELGILIFFMASLRLAAKLKKGMPAAGQFFSSLRTEAYGSRFVLIYLLIIFCGVSGYSFVTSTGKPVYFFGLQIPALIEWGKGAEPLFSKSHDVFVYTTALIILRHIWQRGRSALRRRQSGGRRQKG